jgi:ribonuclease E
MAKNTTKSPNNNEENVPSDPPSVLTRVSKWFKRNPDEVNGDTAPDPSQARAPREPEAAGRPPAEASASGEAGGKPPGEGPQGSARHGKRPNYHKRRQGRSPHKKTTEEKPSAPEEVKAQAQTQAPAQHKPAKEHQKKNPPPQHKPARTPDHRPGMEKPAGPVHKEVPCVLLINADEPEECRIALIESGKVESFHIETISHAQTKGNIYKGQITAVEPNLQAAFVDFGTGKNGFLPFSDIHPEYYAIDIEPGTHWKDLNIQEVIKKGQKVLVEVVKESSGTKGASLTTYLSLPGRYLVLMPGSESAGISRKIEDESERKKLREMVNSLSIPEGIGYIIRTASNEITKTALSQDMRFLLNLWKEIKDLGLSSPTPSLVHREQNVLSRFLRDHFTSEIQEILVDTQEALDQVKNFLQLLPAAQRKKTTVRMHHGTQPIFHQYRVEKQIEQIFHPTVPLPSGGSIVIAPTEALVAIDVNSGSTSKDKNFEETIFLANMEAAEELARQLRLRDLGGLIVVDFIDMRDAKHIREVEKHLKNSMKPDKAKVDFSRISKFGLMQISRQKMATPVQMGSYRICEHCQGRGMIRSVETMALVHLRHIQTRISRKKTLKVLCTLPVDVAQYILNRKREELLELEKQYEVEIIIEVDANMSPVDSKIEFLK